MKYIFIAFLSIFILLPIATEARYHSHHSSPHSSGSHSSGHGPHSSHPSGSHSSGHATPHSTHTSKYTRTPVTHTDVHVSTTPHFNGYVYYYILFNHHSNANDTIWGNSQEEVITQANTAFDESDKEDSKSYNWIAYVLFGLVIVGFIGYTIYIKRKENKNVY